MSYLQKQVSLYMLNMVKVSMDHLIVCAGQYWPASVLECADRVSIELVALRDAILAVKVTQ